MLQVFTGECHDREVGRLFVDGTARILYTRRASAGRFASKTGTETVSLDDYFSEMERVSAIKIDVEGAELDVLQGAYFSPLHASTGV